MKKDCQDYLAPRAIVEKLVLLVLDIQVLVEFVGRQVTQEWMGFQDKQVFQALQVGVAGSAFILERCKAAASQMALNLLLTQQSQLSQVVMLRRTQIISNEYSNGTQILRALDGATY